MNVITIHLSSHFEFVRKDSDYLASNAKQYSILRLFPVTDNSVDNESTIINADEKSPRKKSK